MTAWQKPVEAHATPSPVGSAHASPSNDSNDGAPATARGDLPGLLLRKVAHDIVGPTGVASGALKELERALGDDKSAHAAMMSLAFRSLLRLERLAKRLRLTALLTAGGLELESEPFLLDDLVATATAAASTLDGRKNLAVEGPATSGGLRVKCDKEHLAFAVSELVSNSLRFARKTVRFTAVREGDVVALVFEDDGPGYPPGLPEALRPEGTSIPPEAGLALPIVAILATSFGGRLVLGESALAAAKDKRPGAMARLELPVA